jgi:hypothetical protein
VFCNIYIYRYFPYAPDWPASNGVPNGGLPISMWGSHLSMGRYEQHTYTTRTTLVLAFWKVYDNAILIMSGTS